MNLSSPGAAWQDGLAEYARRLRRGEVSARQVVDDCFERIAAADGKLRAFVHLDVGRARACADGIDRLIDAGVDLGPLMGVPLAVKDLFAVEGMPTRAGSRLDPSDRIGPEGPFVASLKRAGAIILGKVRTIEFAAGAHNISHATPWNPADPDRHRSPGGSSSGSAVAVAAGFCPLALGTDTGGSVRVPASLCGVFGYKSSAGRFPLEGVFPLCPALDSIGFFARSAGDALFVERSLRGAGPLSRDPVGLEGRRVGVPDDRVLADLDAEVADVFEAALRTLERAGVRLVRLDWPSAWELETVSSIFADLVPSDLTATLGRDRIREEQERIDPVALDRLNRAADTTGETYASLVRQQQRLSQLTCERMAEVDAIVQPTSPICAPLVEDLSTKAAAVAFTSKALSLTRIANVYGMTACSLPGRPAGSELPIGLDIAAPAGTDRRLLQLACLVERSLAVC